MRRGDRLAGDASAKTICFPRRTTSLITDPRSVVAEMAAKRGSQSVTCSIRWPRTSELANFEYLATIDLTLQQPEAPRYVARNLFTFFIHDHPSDAVVRDLADGFVASNFQIAPLVRRILRSRAMFSEDARGEQVSSPVEHVVGVARTLDMHIHSEES